MSEQSAHTPDRRSVVLLEQTLASPVVSVQQLRRLAWRGVTFANRARVWKLLLNHAPAAASRVDATMARRRRQYREEVMSLLGEDAFEPTTRYDDTVDERSAKNHHQILLDVPRTHGPPVIHSTRVQRCLTRLLMLWSTRHPASGYVQGINDVMVPFIVVFLSEHADASDDAMLCVESDAYFCASKMLHGVIEQYTASQRELQRNIHRMRGIVDQHDAPLMQHLDAHGVAVQDFAFRWFNCLLVRELPLPLLVRLWDVYVADVDEFPRLHVFVCAAFLCTWSCTLRRLTSMPDLMHLLQRPPTSEWCDDDVDQLLSRAYMFSEGVRALVDSK